jgi:hypothetical protein
MFQNPDLIGARSQTNLLMTVSLAAQSPSRTIPINHYSICAMSCSLANGFRLAVGGLPTSVSLGKLLDVIVG